MSVDQYLGLDQDSRVPKVSVLHVGALVGGRYQITCRLAEGTFGHTYLAIDTHLPNNPECVIKRLKPQTSERAMSMARRLFDTEARILYQLGTHDQIPHLMAHFEDNDEFFLAQEFIDGYPISDELTPDRPWPDTHVVRLLQEILEALSFVHGQRVIHRDIKPGNLIRRKRDGKIVLIDFGAVKEVTTRFFSPKAGETDYTVAIGTFGYIPKEQLGGLPRFSSDIFAVGMIGIQALTGVHPNELMEDEQTAEIQWRDRLTAPINPAFASIIDRMIRYDFRDRYPNAESALRAIQALPKTFREGASTPPWRASSTSYDSLPPTDAFGADVSVVKESGDIEGSTLADVNSQPSDSLHPTPSFHARSAKRSPLCADSFDTLQSQSLSSQTTMGLDDAQAELTQMTDVVAPSFSDLQSGDISASDYPSGASMESLEEFIDPYYRERSLFPPAPFTNAVLGHWKEEVLAATGWAQHWLSRSWRIVALLGGTSLALMLTRGMVASVGVQPVMRLNALETTFVKDAEYLAKQLSSIEDAVSPKVEAMRVLEEAHRAREASHYQEAMGLYQQSLGIDPTLTDAIWGKCATLNAQQQFEIASSVCYEALAMEPNHARALWSSAEANESMGLYEQAATERSRALTLDPNLPSSLAHEVISN